MRETPLQLEVRQMYLRLWPEYESALKECRRQFPWSDRAEQQAMAAWSRKFDAEVDVIMQRHGMPGMIYELKRA